MMECGVLRLRLATTLALTLATAAMADGPVAVPVDGKPFHGQLVDADSSGTLTFLTDSGTKAVSADNLVRWGAFAVPDRPPLFLLRNGTLLVAGILEVTQEELALDSDSLGLIRLPLQELRAIVLQLPAPGLVRDRLLDDAIRGNEETARIIMLNGDQLHGELIDFDDQSVTLRTSVGSVRLELERVSTITLASTPGVQRPPGRATVVGLTDGSRLAVNEMIGKDQVAALKSADGLKWKTDLKDIVFLQPVSTRITYLSELEPIGYRHVPFLDRTWRFHADRNVLGGQMRCAGQTYLKGIGMHTAARLSYAPPDGTQAFQASLGIDDITEGMGSVRFRVFVDGDQKYVSPTVRGLEAPVPIAVDVEGAARVDLVVDFADRADVQDLANWLDARFIAGE